MPLEFLPWSMLGLALGASGLLAWRIGRTRRTRWISFGLYGLIFIIIVAVGLLVLNIVERLFMLDPDPTVRTWTLAGLAGFWLLAVGLAGLRVRKYHE